MSISTIVAILKVLVWLARVVNAAYANLTPSEKETIHKEYLEWQEAIKKVQDPMGGKMDGP